MRLGNDRIGLLGVLLVVVIATVSSLLGDPPPPSGRTADVSVRRPAPDPAGVNLAGLREFSIDIGEKRDSRGTAFSVGEGAWMTARHVVDGCDVVGVLASAGRGVGAREVSIHSNADVAIMKIQRSVPSVRFADRDPQSGDIAYHVGYPRGMPGELRSRMIGMRAMTVRGRYSTREPVIAWAEIERIPDDSKPLSGLSGGPVFNPQGQLIGVHVAGSVRRGRSFSAHPASIRQIMKQAKVQEASDWAEARFSPMTLPSVANALRAEKTVALALCDVH